MRYQGATHGFWVDDVLNSGENNVSKSSLSQNVRCIPNVPGVDGALYGVWWCEPTDVVQKWSPKSSSYLKVLKACKYPEISELPLQKIPWEMTNLKRNFVILEIIDSASSIKNDKISFALLIKLLTVCAMSLKSKR